MHGRDAAGVQRVGNGLSDADDALFRVRGMEIRAAGIGLRGVGMDDKDERPLLRAIERESRLRQRVRLQRSLLILRLKWLHVFKLLLGIF